MIFEENSWSARLNSASNSAKLSGRPCGVRGLSTHCHLRFAALEDTDAAVMPHAEYPVEHEEISRCG